jgi:predicted metal-dependent hydrolase
MTMNLPPDYRLRVSRWARGISLRVTLAGAVEVVAPRRYSPRTIARVLRSETEWIASAQAAVAARRRALPPLPTWELPQEILLPGMGARWIVVAKPLESRSVRVLSERPDVLVVAGPVANLTNCRRALRMWLLRQGQVYLPSRLAAVSHGCGLPYARSTVRMARSRWGSCSRGGVISLSARLLLLPSSLVDYVLVHELCHTREPNHSPAFWRLVARYCPTYPIRRKELRAAGKRLPAWILDPEERQQECTAVA